MLFQRRKYAPTPPASAPNFSFPVNEPRGFLANGKGPVNEGVFVSSLQVYEGFVSRGGQCIIAYMMTFTPILIACW